MKVEVAVLGSPSLIILMVSVGVKQYPNLKSSSGSRFGLAVRRYSAVKQKDPQFDSASALLPLQMLWSVDTVL